MPSFCSRVLESQTLSFSRASAGILTGRRGKCRESNHRRTASPNSGALGRSYMLTIGAYETQTIAMPHQSLGHHHSFISFPILPIFMNLSLLPSSLSSRSQHNGKHYVVMAAEKGGCIFLHMVLIKAVRRSQDWIALLFYDTPCIFCQTGTRRRLLQHRVEITRRSEGFLILHMACCQHSETPTYCI